MFLKVERRYRKVVSSNNLAYELIKWRPKLSLKQM